MPIVCSRAQTGLPIVEYFFPTEHGSSRIHCCNPQSSNAGQLRCWWVSVVWKLGPEPEGRSCALALKTTNPESTSLIYIKYPKLPWKPLTWLILFALSAQQPCRLSWKFWLGVFGPEHQKWHLNLQCCPINNPHRRLKIFGNRSRVEFCAQCVGFR